MSMVERSDITPPILLFRGMHDTHVEHTVSYLQSEVLESAHTPVHMFAVGEGVRVVMLEGGCTYGAIE